MNWTAIVRWKRGSRLAGFGLGRLPGAGEWQLRETLGIAHAARRGKTGRVYGEPGACLGTEGGLCRGIVKIRV
jgi:hypothetical protein